MYLLITVYLRSSVSNYCVTIYIYIYTCIFSECRGQFFSNFVFKSFEMCVSVYVVKQKCHILI